MTAMVIAETCSDKNETLERNRESFINLFIPFCSEFYTYTQDQRVNSQSAVAEETCRKSEEEPPQFRNHSKQQHSVPFFSNERMLSIVHTSQAVLEEIPL